MTKRALRQYYGDERNLTIEGLPHPAEPFRRHRARFSEALAALSDEEWATPTRCDAWTAADICNHLVTADGFWALTLGGRGAPEPTTYLRGFEPSATPEHLVAPMRTQSRDVVLSAFAASTQQLADALDGVGDDEWHLRSESPVGHVPVRTIAAHALWDSWLHERDVLVPVGRPPAVEADELETATAFTLFFAGSQGGVLHDPAPVDDGPEAPIDVVLTFDDLGGRVFHLQVTDGVRVDVAARSTDVHAVTSEAGGALAFVEGFAGRSPLDAGALPPDLAAQLARAARIL